MIGIFDSGSGGLTVMQAIEREIPDQSFLYLGDHRYAPYGNRSSNQIYSLTLRALEILFARGCSLVVMACNTAAATGLRQLQQTWLPVRHPNRRVLGVIVPVVEAITGIQGASGDRTSPTIMDVSPTTVAIFVTTHTVQTKSYVTEIRLRSPDIRVTQKACPDLVGLIETDAPQSKIRESVQRYVGELIEESGVPDICILGCTQYPIIQSHFVAEMPDKVRLFSQPDITANSLLAYLDRHPHFRTIGALHNQFLTTGDTAHVSTLASRFYGRPVEFTSVGR